MAIGLAHEEYRNHVASGLSVIVERLDAIVGNSVWRASATNAATLKAAMAAQASPTNFAIHEADKAGFQTAIRYLDTQYNLGILVDADVAAMNDLSSSRAQFTDEDPVLASSNNGAPHRFGATR